MSVDRNALKVFCISLEPLNTKARVAGFPQCRKQTKQNKKNKNKNKNKNKITESEDKMENTENLRKQQFMTQNKNIQENHCFQNILM